MIHVKGLARHLAQLKGHTLRNGTRVLRSIFPMTSPPPGDEEGSALLPSVVSSHAGQREALQGCMYLQALVGLPQPQRELLVSQAL